MTVSRVDYHLEGLADKLECDPPVGVVMAALFLGSVVSLFGGLV